MLLRILAMAAVLFLLASPAAWPCACSQTSPGQCQGLQQADGIFLGTVTTIQEMPNAPTPPPAAPLEGTDSAGNTSTGAAGPPVDAIASRLTRYHFHIDEQFAGSDSAEGSEVDIFSGGSDGDCGYRFKSDGQYVVFAHRGKDGRLFAAICDGTRPASDARALLPQLRAMRDGRRVASVFGRLRRTDPPFLAAAANDPDDPLPNVSVKIRSHDDRFETSTDADGVFRFYDVHAGEYSLTADLPAGTGLTQKSLGGLQPFTIPDGACFEYDVDALPTGSIHGSVLGPNGKPLDLASLELYRAGNYSSSRPGFWAFQGADGSFDFDHIGPGDYILVFNRANRMNPNAPFKRAFYPGVADLSEAQPIHLDDGQNLSKIDIHVSDRYAARKLRVQLKWIGARPPGNVTVAVKADQGENPAADEIGDDLFEVTLLESANYKISAWEDLDPERVQPHRRRKAADCPPPERVDATSVSISGSDADVKKVILAFPKPGCGDTQK